MDAMTHTPEPSQGDSSSIIKEEVAQTSSPQPLRHSNYYFNPVIFRVEGILFRVPKNGFLVPDTIFHTMFTLPIAEGAAAEGLTDSNPIELLGISERDFYAFLLIMYPFIGRPTKYEELVGALHLATMWNFQDIRVKAISFLSPILNSRDVVENIILAKRFRVKRWLREGYLKLIKEDIQIQKLRDPLELDWETISRIFAVQAHARKRSECQSCAHVFNARIDIDAYLDTTFKPEFSEMED